MKRRTAAIVAAFMLPACARMPAWSEAAAGDFTTGTPPAPTPARCVADPHDTWEAASDLRRWLETIYGTGRELTTWL